MSFPATSASASRPMGPQTPTIGIRPCRAEEIGLYRFAAKDSTPVSDQWKAWCDVGAVVVGGFSGFITTGVLLTTDVAKNYFWNSENLSDTQSRVWIALALGTGIGATLTCFGERAIRHKLTERAESPDKTLQNLSIAERRWLAHTLLKSEENYPYFRQWITQSREKYQFAALNCTLAKAAKLSCAFTAKISEETTISQTPRLKALVEDLRKKVADNRMMNGYLGKIVESIFDVCNETEKSAHLENVFLQYAAGTSIEQTKTNLLTLCQSFKPIQDCHDREYQQPGAQ